MNVLGLCSYPIEAAATRYRLAQFVAPLGERGINLEMSPFLTSAQFNALYRGGARLKTALGLQKSFLRRLAEIFRMRRYDLLFVQREAMFFGPAFFEWVFRQIGRVPVILDLDDATYIPYVSPTYGRIGSFFKFFGKTDRLIERADAVICGNRFIAEYVEKKGTKTVVVPTVVDTDKFVPVEKNNPVPVIGWIGTHSTYPSLETLFPVLRRISEKYDFVLKVVGAGVDKIEIENVKVENLAWKLDREISDFQTLDIGLYPITTSSSASEAWLVGKSGFKAIQYLSAGIPFVVTPVGVCAEIGIDGETHFSASHGDAWQAALEKLLASAETRRRMGAKGREHALEHYTVGRQTDKIVSVFQNALENSDRKVKL